MNKNIPVGKCDNCDCGTRPGPWHNKDCPAYMKTEKFTQEDTNETQSIN